MAKGKRQVTKEGRVTVYAASELTQVRYHTLQRAVGRGELEVFRETPRGHGWVLVEDVEAWAMANGYARQVTAAA